MLLESVPALRDARVREHWREVAASGGKGTCISHEMYPESDAEAPANDDNPLMAEIEPGHLVTCATVDDPNGCRQNTSARSA